MYLSLTKNGKGNARPDKLVLIQVVENYSLLLSSFKMDG